MSGQLTIPDDARSAPHRPARPRSALLFRTVGDVFEAFPSARADVGPADPAEDSIAFLRGAVARGAWASALTFCAYLLPRRQAVWWGAQSLRRLNADSPGVKALEAAEAWVRRPEEDERQAALKAGIGSDGRLPTTWIAIAAARSRGSLLPAEFATVPAPRDQTAKAVRAAMLMVRSRIPDDEAAEAIGPCLDYAMTLAQGPSGGN